ncbi:hypothetical protein J4418_05075 [Candidatus Woesearchaeota archaeon]|nr:hypothetical protein [Candidatus Woesearchaeota archaeon]
MMVMNVAGPAFTDNNTNFTTLKRYEDGLFNISISDVSLISGYYLEYNCGDGILRNDTFTAVGATAIDVSNNITACSSRGNLIYWRYYANDSRGNWGASTQWNLNITNSLPKISKVRFTDTVTSFGTCPSCTLNPVSGSNITFAVLINATDIDQDCTDDAYGELNLYLCINQSSYQGCSSTAYNYTYNVDSISKVNNDCLFQFSANKTKDTLQFFHPANTYRYHINLTDHDERNPSDAAMNNTWTFGSLTSVNYPTSVILGGATIKLGQWSSGNNEYVMTNYGNTVVSALWNATDLVRAASALNWTPDGTDFQIDDDNLQSSEASGLIAPVYLSANESSFNYTTGLDICVSKNCNSAAYNETLPTYYHIMPPVGLEAGTYADIITYRIFTVN